MEYDDIAESRFTIIEARLAFCEQRMAALERYIGGVIKSSTKRRRELTPEERKAVRARLVGGQERARAKREAEAKAQAQAKSNNSKK